MARSGFPKVTQTLRRNLEVSGPNRRSNSRLRILSYNLTPTWASAGGARTNVKLLASETQLRKQCQGCRRRRLVVDPSLEAQPPSGVL